MKAEWTNADSLTASQTTKAILVIEMPNDCNECPLNSNGYCDVLQEYALLNEWVEDAPYYDLKGKGDCPLKPMPEKKEPSVQLSVRHNDEPMETLGFRCTDYEKGWNACLEELEK